MSRITDTLVWVDAVSDGIAVSLAAPLPFDTTRGQSLRRIDMADAGGVKVFTTDVYAAALNWIDEGELEAWFRGLPWGPYDHATLRWDTEGEHGGVVDIGAYDGS